MEAYLRNCWYAAALSDEVTSQPLARTLLDEPVAIYRTDAGQAVILSDRCPHRFAPLHTGKVFGDSLRCPYHGLRFNAQGKCVHNPIGNGAVPPTARVKSYPVHESDGFIWVWMGSEAPDEKLVPRYPELDAPGWPCYAGLIEMDANYALVSDNLLDLSHAEFLHPDLVTEGYSGRGKLVVEQDGDTVVARNHRPKEPIAKAQRLGFGTDAPDHIDRTSIVTWQAPANLRIEFIDAPVDQPELARRVVAAHLITPESEATCHYFFRAARDFKVDDEATTAKMLELTTKAFVTEDKPMIEAQQRNLRSASFESMKPLLLPSDNASVRARRILARKFGEQAAEPTASVHAVADTARDSVVKSA